MKVLSSLLLFFAFLFLMACNFNTQNESKKSVCIETQIAPKDEFNIAFLKEKAIEAKEYCQSQNINSEFYILIDLKIHSGLKRFFVWDFNNDTLIYAFLVSHGCAQNPWGKDLSKLNAAISNENDSHASSIGKYIIGKRGYSNWGVHINYLLHGKEATNSNALQRQIVLHSWELVSDHVIYPSGTPEGWGCPAVSDSSMLIIDELLVKSQKNVLMWVIK